MHPKYIKHGWIGYTFTKVLAFLILYYVITIIVAIGTNINDKESCGIYKDGEYYKNTTSKSKYPKVDNNDRSRYMNNCHILSNL